MARGVGLLGPEGESNPSAKAGATSRNRGIIGLPHSGWDGLFPTPSTLANFSEGEPLSVDASAGFVTYQ